MEKIMNKALNLIKEQYIKYEKVFKTEEDNTNKLIISTTNESNTQYDNTIKIGEIDINFKTEDFDDLGSLHPRERLAIIGAIIVNEIDNYLNK